MAKSFLRPTNWKSIAIEASKNGNESAIEYYSEAFDRLKPAEIYSCLQKWKNELLDNIRLRDESPSETFESEIKKSMNNRNENISRSRCLSEGSNEGNRPYCEIESTQSDSEDAEGVCDELTQQFLNTRAKLSTYSAARWKPFDILNFQEGVVTLQSSSLPHLERNEVNEFQTGNLLQNLPKNNHLISLDETEILRRYSIHLQLAEHHYQMWLQMSKLEAQQKSNALASNVNKSNYLNANTGKVNYYGHALTQSALVSEINDIKHYEKRKLQSDYLVQSSHQQKKMKKYDRHAKDIITVVNLVGEDCDGGDESSIHSSNDENADDVISDNSKTTNCSSESYKPMNEFPKSEFEFRNSQELSNLRREREALPTTNPFVRDSYPQTIVSTTVSSTQTALTNHHRHLVAPMHQHHPRTNQMINGSLELANKPSQLPANTSVQPMNVNHSSVVPSMVGMGLNRPFTQGSYNPTNIDAHHLSPMSYSIKPNQTDNVPLKIVHTSTQHIQPNFEEQHPQPKRRRMVRQEPLQVIINEPKDNERTSNRSYMVSNEPHLPLNLPIPSQFIIHQPPHAAPYSCPHTSEDIYADLCRKSSSKE